MKEYRHIIWDWNGTLVDDAGLCLEIINQLLGERGLSWLSQKDYQQAFTFPVRDFYSNVGFDFSTEPYEEVAARFMAIYDARRRECRLQTGARALLNFFSEQGITQSVLSAYEQGRLEEMVAHHRLHGFFTHIIGLNDYYSASKVEQGTRYLSQLACEKHDVVLIGDSLHDAEVAMAMGIDCLLVPCGHFSRERLLTAGVPVLHSLEALQEYLTPNLPVQPAE